MNMNRFREFSEKAYVLIQSSNWLTNQMDKYMLEAELLDVDSDPARAQELIRIMEYLQSKSDWESEQVDLLKEEYRDVLNT